MSNEHGMVGRKLSPVLQRALETREVYLVADVAAAQLIGSTPGTMRRWRRERRGPRYSKIGSTVRYRVDDLCEYVASRTVETKDTREIAASQQ